jgi:hypothetical protein
VYSALDPQWLFRFAGMEPLNQPGVFVCLAMVVGLYGIVYLEVARNPERGWLLATSGTRREDPRTNWFGSPDRNGRVAGAHVGVVLIQRSDMVASL